MKNYQPAAGWVLLQAEELAEQTAGGIIKPQAALDNERKLGADNAPAFLVLKTGADSGFGVLPSEAVHLYPRVGSKVFVLNKPLSIVVLNKSMLLANMDVVVGTVTEENA